MNWGSVRRGDRSVEYSGSGLVIVMMRAGRRRKKTNVQYGRKENEVRGRTTGGNFEFER